MTAIHATDMNRFLAEQRAARNSDATNEEWCIDEGICPCAINAFIDGAVATHKAVLEEMTDEEEALITILISSFQLGWDLHKAHPRTRA